MARFVQGQGIFCDSLKALFIKIFLSHLGGISVEMQGVKLSLGKLRQSVGINPTSQGQI